MSRQRPSNDLTQPPSSRALVSRTSILILSGLLLGMVARHAVPAATEPYAYLTAMVGLIAWLGLSYSAHRRETKSRQVQTERRSREQVVRIYRHLSAPSEIRRDQPPSGSSETYRSYLPVAKSSKAMRRSAADSTSLAGRQRI